MIKKRGIVFTGLSQIIRSSFNCRVFLEEEYSYQSIIAINHIASLNIVLLDCRNHNIENTIREIRRIKSSIEILIFAQQLDYDIAIDCLIAGAKGFILQNCEIDEISKAIFSLLHHKKYWCRDLLEKMAIEALKNAEELHRANVVDTQISGMQKMSHRQKQIITYLLTDMPQVAIAEKLSISNSAVSQYKANIFRTLHVNTRTELRNLCASMNYLTN